MKVEKDYEEFVRLLNAQNVEYLLVGAYAVAQYTEPRNTGLRPWSGESQRMWEKRKEIIRKLRTQ